MSDINVKFFSKELNRKVSFDIIIPNDVQYGESPRHIRTLFLLHGYTGSAENWVPKHLCEKYGFAVVLPNGENSFWLDGMSSGHSYCRFVGVELVDYIRKTFGLAQCPEDTYILGLSMGGFGSIHTALKYPERFGKLGAMSSALIHREVATMTEGSSNGVANYEYYRECFGEPSELLASENNPEVLALADKENGTLPEMYLCCGTEDFLLERNREFHKFLTENEIPHIYLESGGSHDYTFWDEYTIKIIDWMFA